jgi:purine-binding chemotaxis protein CheW
MADHLREREVDAFLVDDDEESSQASKYLLFNIDDEVYGINIAHVVEIIEMQRITEVPDMPPFVKGVINLRGRVIPVVDLRLRFGMAEREHDDRTCMIIVRIGSSSVGFIVDTVAEVQDIQDSDVEPPPQFRTSSGRDQYISGLGKVGDSVRILIDVRKLVSEDELRAGAQA